MIQSDFSVTIESFKVRFNPIVMVRSSSSRIKELGTEPQLDNLTIVPQLCWSTEMKYRNFLGPIGIVSVQLFAILSLLTIFVYVPPKMQYHNGPIVGPLFGIAIWAAATSLVFIIRKRMNATSLALMQMACYPFPAIAVFILFLVLISRWSTMDSKKLKNSTKSSL